MNFISLAKFLSINPISLLLFQTWLCQTYLYPTNPCQTWLCQTWHCFYNPKQHDSFICEVLPSNLLSIGSNEKLYVFSLLSVRLPLSIWSLSSWFLCNLALSNLLRGTCSNDFSSLCTCSLHCATQEDFTCGVIQSFDLDCFAFFETSGTGFRLHAPPFSNYPACVPHIFIFFVSCTWFSGPAHSITITHHVVIFSKYMSIKYCFSILSDLSYIEPVGSTFVLSPVTVPNLYFHFGTVGQSWFCHCQCFFATQMG